ncbi:thiamine transport system ATP-binding protein [Rhodovulum imhoffii]|uniref:Thiamine transport system ATP-binding protein n=1 Tax=Rhodovulum imhoffii TaxID=365340 RepID=A0A2T5BPD8_9RHOB|nr:ATP-binding cassette domain-containing protein [Rhodovulum imhoffii]MBK5932646.1 thiamine ABC transporter ATP-binding protein [Rhodovulum imhoffii]PTN00899.1 thiamine transport system ATP-binding protein [Rhodovulum imhoffii]
MLRLETLEIVLDGFRLAADFSVPTGQTVAILGPSGAGKSTLLDVIAGFVPAASGRILWNETDLNGLSPGARPVSVLFQDNNLFPHLTVAQNAGLGLRSDLRLGPEHHQSVMDSLARVGLAGMERRKPATLSGGQRSRAALARMLLRGRPLMLLDEPFAALGPALKADMLALVADLATETGATVLMVTHDPEDARAIAPLTCLVAEGLVQPPHGTIQLLRNPPPALRRYLG